MKSLEVHFLYKGFEYRQEWRDENFAIYSQWLNNELIAYESIKILKNKAREYFGKKFEESERYPNDNQWGNYGFTSKTLIEAQNILLKHFPNLRNLYSPTPVKPRSPLEPYMTTPHQAILINAGA